MNLVIPALAVGYLFYSGMKSMGERLQKCEISSFKLGKLSIGLQQTTIPVVLNIFNPNNTDVPAEYFRGIISRAGKKVGDFTFDSKGERILLKARQETPITFNTRITTVGVLSNLVNIFKNLFAAKPLDTVFTISGIISIGGFDLPVNFSYDVKTQKVVDSVNGINGIPEWRSNYIDIVQTGYGHWKISMNYRGKKRYARTTDSSAIDDYNSDEFEKDGREYRKKRGYEILKSYIRSGNYL